jgi:oxygen-independent coproporphyrinogen-3 oxidase
MPSLAQLNLGSGIRLRELPRAHVPGLYVHIPFCFHKCHYCDFYSITHQDERRMSRFVDLMHREAELWRDARQLTILPKTIFFGGGTPSLLPLDQMRRLIAGLRERIDLSHVNECTVEVNPATANFDYCKMLRENGVDRLSFGAQSYDRDELKLLERHHDPQDVQRSIELARRAGFSRLNVDLIYAIPGQSMQSWARSLDAAIQLRTPHLSCYALTYEPNTPMAVKKRLGHFQAASDELELEMARLARQRLGDAGLRAYEISNYASAGEECPHNLLYWTGGSYVGLGPSAASHVEGTRFKNRPHLGEWERAIERHELPAVDVEVLTPPQRAGELIMLQLRLTRGVDLADFKRRTGQDAVESYSDLIDRLINARLLQLDNHHLRLTDSGLNVADAVAAEFLAAQ